MRRKVFPLFLFALLSAWAVAQTGSSHSTVPANQPAPSSQKDTSASESSADKAAPSRATGEESSSISHRVDISPPKDDAKNHPFSSEETEEDEPPSDVQNFHPWDPHRAAKNLEVGEFYLKRKNYRAAESRFREALVYKSDYAMAKYRLGETLEKLGEFNEAKANYEGYLKILPEGPLSADAHKAIDRLSKEQK